MNDIIIIAVLCLLTACIILTAMLLGYKRQIREFTQHIKKSMSDKCIEYVSTDIFAKEIVELAVSLNEYTDMQKKLRNETEIYKNELSNMVSGISHDFRTPLTSALGYMQLIAKSGELSEKNSGYIKIAIEKNKYLKELSDDFFEMSKLERNTEDIKKEKTDLSSLVSEIILSRYKWITEKGLKTNFNIQENIFIESDRHRLERIIENLLSNAEKYSQSFLDISLISQSGQTSLIISNDAPDEETDTQKIFEPFYRSRSRNQKGSGLGLYVAKCLCNDLGMDIKADVTDGKFKITVTI